MVSSVSIIDHQIQPAQPFHRLSEKGNSSTLLGQLSLITVKYAIRILAGQRLQHMLGGIKIGVIGKYHIIACLSQAIDDPPANPVTTAGHNSFLPSHSASFLSLHWCFILWNLGSKG